MEEQLKCPECGVTGKIRFTATYTDETHTEVESTGYECWGCGAEIVEGQEKPLEGVHPDEERRPAVRVLVCGSRTWSNRERIREVLLHFKPTVVIEGEARGADFFARSIAEELEAEVLPFPADWERHGKSAGVIRNKQMLIEGKPDLVLAFIRDDSRGTTDMIAQARAAGVPVEVYKEEE